MTGSKSAVRRGRGGHYRRISLIRASTPAVGGKRGQAPRGTFFSGAPTAFGSEPVPFCRGLVALSLLLGFAGSAGFQEAVAAEVDRVLLISCDGLRPDAISPDRSPVLQGLIDGGSYQGTALDELPPITLPNHVSMVTGLGTARHGVFLNQDLPGRVAATTIFDLARDAGLRVGFFVSKTKLGYLCEEGGADVWRVVPDVDGIAAEVIAAVEQDDLQLVFVHFGEPDGAGHRDGWMSDSYLAAVARVDAAIGRILDAMQAKGTLARAVVMITADHGGHWNTHFMDIPEDRHIPFIINGYGIAAGRRLCEQVHVTDAAATAVHQLGLPETWDIDGKPVVEASSDYVQPTCTPSPAGLGWLCGSMSLPLLVPLVLFLAWRGRQRAG